MCGEYSKSNFAGWRRCSWFHPSGAGREGGITQGRHHLWVGAGSDKAVVLTEHLITDIELAALDRPVLVGELRKTGGICLSRDRLVMP